MKLNETQKVDTNLYELNITVDGEQYAKALDASFKKNAAKLNIPGFRKGKAPRKMIEAMYELGVYDAKEKLQQVKKFLRESKEESRDYTHGQAQQQTAVTQQTR